MKKFFIILMLPFLCSCSALYILPSVEYEDITVGDVTVFSGNGDIIAEYVGVRADMKIGGNLNFLLEDGTGVIVSGTYIYEYDSVRQPVNTPYNMLIAKVTEIRDELDVLNASLYDKSPKNSASQNKDIDERIRQLNSDLSLLGFKYTYDRLQKKGTISKRVF